MNKIKNILVEKPILCFELLLIVFKTMVVGSLGIYAIASSIHDDALMVDVATNLLQGDWLGTYDNRRLVKGITGPLLLALNHITGIPWLMTITLFYGVVCSGFVKTISNFIQNKWMLAFLFVSIYFVPVTTTSDTLLRVYRNSLVPIFTVFLFTCFINMYLKRQQKRFIFWSVTSGFSLAVFWNLREDAIWILPFVMAVALIMLIQIILENRKTSKKWFKANLFCILIPFMILGSINFGIKVINYQYYGVFIRNELAEGGFSELMRAIYSVEQDEDYFRVSVPKSTVDKLYLVSPTFATLQPDLDANFGAGWDGADGELDGQIKDGWFFWCLRDTIATQVLATDASIINDFCYQVAAEINQALEDGRIDRREWKAMPSALMSPWKEHFTKELPIAVWDAFWSIAKHEGCDLRSLSSVGDTWGIGNMEAITHMLAIPPSENRIEISGWIVSYNDETIVDIAIYQGEKQIAILPRAGGQDIYEYYLSNGISLENAKNSRFNYGTTFQTSTEDLWLYILQNGAVIERTELNGQTDNNQTDDYQWYIDAFSTTKPSAIEISAQSRIELLQKINIIYQKFGIHLTILGLVAYAFLTVLLMMQVIKKKIVLLLDVWLVLTGLVFSTLVLCVGVGYTHISGYYAITPLYLTGGYPLMVVFNLIGIMTLIQYFKKPQGLENEKNE